MNKPKRMLNTYDSGKQRCFLCFCLRLFYFHNIGVLHILEYSYSF